MNAVLWAWHVAVLYYSWPLLRAWWDGEIERKRWLVALSIGMPPLAAIWLLPFAIDHRADLRRQERQRAEVERQNAGIRQRAADVAYWREQAASDDPVAQQNAVELLGMWQVPVVEPKTHPGPHGYLRWCECERCYAARGVIPPWLVGADPEPMALPGAHAYSGDCSCRNCVRSRRLL